MKRSSEGETSVNIYDAKTGFSKLIGRVEDGERVTISRNGRPVARLIPYVVETPRREPGLWRGRVTLSADFDELSPADEREWYGA